MVELKNVEMEPFIKLTDGREFMILCQLMVEDELYLFMADITGDIDFIFVKQLPQDELAPVTDKNLLKMLGQMVSEHIEQITKNLNYDDKIHATPEEVKKSYYELMQYINEEQ